ncbi:MAG TPA: hypothetical protein VKU41_06140 [Polyangiaceae bacterium]|nr:hypothetical protein [Polyangiaceae bacterium]
MLDRNDLWLMEGEVPLDEPADVLEAMPEIRQLVDPDRDDDELGLRSLLEDPEVLSNAWWHSALAERRPRTLRRLRRHAGVLRAA